MPVVTKSVADSQKFQNAVFLQLVTRPFDIRRPAAVEVLLLLALCSLDMFSTIYWVRTGQATESNPFLAWTFHLHPLLFVLVKVGTYLPPLLLAAYLARRHPRLVTILLRVVILAYVGLYLYGVLRH